MVMRKFFEKTCCHTTTDNIICEHRIKSTKEIWLRKNWLCVSKIGGSSHLISSIGHIVSDHIFFFSKFQIYNVSMFWILYQQLLADICINAIPYCVEHLICLFWKCLTATVDPFFPTPPDIITRAFLNASTPNTSAAEYSGISFMSRWTNGSFGNW